MLRSVGTAEQNETAFAWAQLGTAWQGRSKARWSGTPQRHSKVRWHEALQRQSKAKYCSGKEQSSCVKAEHSVVSIGAGTAWRTKAKPGQSNVWTDAQRRNGAMRSFEMHGKEMVAD